MGTIVERKNKSGSKFRAQVIKKDEGKIVLSTSATFARKSTAAAWITANAPHNHTNQMSRTLA